jgi:hypothetical protein
LKQLDNDALTIEKADIRPTRSRKQKAAPATPPQTEHVPLKPKRDSGGGFNPYDHAGKPRRR